MYESFYGLRTNPFSLVPDPGFLYLGKQHKLALSLLEYGLLNRAVFTVITGEPGTGKTTLLNAILDQSQHQVVVGMLSNTHAGLGSLMPWVLMAFNLNGKGMDSVELYRTFTAFLAHEYEQRRRVVLVVDEAQNLGSAMLEELRLLSNLNDGRRQSLQIILSGQPGLRALLQRGDLVQFAQRISVDYHLEPFDEDETPRYVRHRLMVAGMTSAVMTELACRVVHRLAGGNPRLINQVCDVSLAYGFAEQARVVTAGLVMKAATDRAASGILPLTPSSVADLFTPEAEQKEKEEASSAASTADKTATTIRKPEVRDHSAPTSYQRGLAHKEAGQYRQAIACFDQARQDSTMAVKAGIQTALCYKSADRLDDAVALLRQLLKDTKGTDGERRQIRYMLGRIYEWIGRTEEALAHYKVLQREDPAFLDTTARVGQLSSSRPWSTRIAGSFKGSWLRSMTKRWVHLLRVSF